MRWQCNLLLAIVLSTVALGTPLHGQTVDYTNETEMGIMWSRANFFSPVAATVQTFHGVQFDGVLSMGLTVGLDEYFGLHLLPIAVGSRAVLPCRKVSPYLGVEVGYGFTWLEKKTASKWHEGGMVFHPAIGVRWKAGGKDRYLINIGYKRQAVAEHNADAAWGPGSFRTARYALNRMTVGFGMIF
ncbi:hypothetical protein [Parapedobacter sp.]